MEGQHIILNAIRQPRESDTALAWVCDSLGFSAEMPNRIIDALLKELRQQPSISSEELARQLEISSARLNHHIRNFVIAGFLAREKKRIVLRGESLQATVREIRKDAERIFDSIEEIAKEIDAVMGFAQQT